MISEALLMDNMEYMSQFPDGFFDLAVVDPPYGININNSMGRRKGYKKSDYKKAVWDNQSPPQEYFNELFRVSNHQIIWGANHFISKMPFDSACWLMWDKKFSDEVSFAQYEMAWTSLDGTCKKFDRHPTQKKRIHPTQKPVALYDWIYAKYLPQGGKVLDTHLGSGSNRIAADKAGNIDFYSCENDPDHYADQEKRWRQYKSQLVLKFT